jgi:hypothetical protein
LLLRGDADGRLAWTRRLRDLVSDATSDLGGDTNLSSAERVLVRRASMLTLQLEMMEAHWGENDGEASPTALQNYQRGLNTLRRTYEALGLKRRARDITGPTLGELLRRDHARQMAEAADAEAR